ncbi:MerR family transcriptional regulator [Vagococcus sp. DIV0080]|uniref:MerR family transcriptional regulator n=1 Tax=Candidatus Vagococcus giribetii TaxID=2230876 RepID=A0ABS3HQH8_9ENTE|nr:MerR family transcriptional regulator [Vagococcus sp. DIV0080]MBO0475984.1 MerR family transcriptional regulator [Vagococcus sp. DIV0080]
MFIKEFSQKTGLTIDTLRYYEKEQLLIPKRTDKNYRYYTEKDLCWVELLLKLKETGMTINEIKQFSALQEEGDSSLLDRTILLQAHIKNLNEQRSNLDNTIAFVEKKIEGYQERFMKFSDFK